MSGPKVLPRGPVGRPSLGRQASHLTSERAGRGPPRGPQWAPRRRTSPVPRPAAWPARALTMRVLIAEDDEGLRSVLARGLEENGYVVDAVADGEAAVRYLRTYDYEVAVLDWRMPKASGIDALTEVRRVGVRTPVLMLTARDALPDRVTGLNAGADDYLVKPFEFSELLARLHALQRRPALHYADRL